MIRYFPYFAFVLGLMLFFVTAKADVSEPGILHLNTQTGEMSFCGFIEPMNFTEIVCVQLPIEVVRQVSEQCAMDVQSSTLVCGKDLEQMSF